MQSEVGDFATTPPSPRGMRDSGGRLVQSQRGVPPADAAALRRIGRVDLQGVAGESRALPDPPSADARAFRDTSQCVSET